MDLTAGQEDTHQTEAYAARQPSVLIQSESLGAGEASRLQDLTTEVRDQDDLERDVNRQADQLLTEQADDRDQKRFDKTQLEKDRLQAQITRLRKRRRRPTGSATSVRLDNEITQLEAQVQRLETDLDQITDRIKQRHGNEQSDGGDVPDASGNRRMPYESRREFLIRTGKITPFSKIHGRTLGRSDSSLQGVLLDAEEEDLVEDGSQSEPEVTTMSMVSHRNLLQPGFDDDGPGSSTENYSRPLKQRRLHPPVTDVSPETGVADREGSLSTDESAFIPEGDSRQQESPHRIIDDEAYDTEDPTTVIGGKVRKQSRSVIADVRKEDLTGLDDGDERLYQQRLRRWKERRMTARNRAAHDIRNSKSSPEPQVKSEENEEDDEHNFSADYESHQPHPTRQDTLLDGGFRIPGDIYPSLFDYQKTGVQWLCELYAQQVGGIVGDEMGLGKTIQVIAFLAGLHYSKKLSKPVIVVAPATVMKQWVNEFHTWWPPLRVSILHTSGSGMLDVGREVQEEEDLFSHLPGAPNSKPQSKSQKKAKQIVDRVMQDGHVLVTTYSGLQSYADLLIPVDWEYAILDEGHKIRNPNTAITIYCKELRTANRVILSGTPMQNNLIELWSLFDFIFPMRLGTLVNFRQQFEIPIRQGGYANASNLQVQTAMKCAETLKDAISPYLLQRFKADVASDLPRKSEQVLFCKLTKLQREAYEGFLASDELKAIMNGKRQMLYGVDILRKICNHPDLVEHKTLSTKPSYNYGNSAKSGKMQVVKALLELWIEQGHKMLLFAQHRIMLDILEKAIKSMNAVRYRRMDGTTTISSRQGLVDEFNLNPDIHVFLLTTKVGGLGVNLTGADRVIIFDPDWNPSTDVQARERAWRLGQKREVMIYRLMTAGTIEEKIYHRQLFKQFLINKILRDPKQRQSFQMKDLHDLFSLGGVNEYSTETGSLFQGSEIKFLRNRSDSIDAASANGERLETGDDRSTSIDTLTGVAHMERFHGEEEQKRTGIQSNGTNSDARIMEGIFARSGVHSALEHDHIVSGKKVVRADPHIIEREAKRVASEAAKELRKAGETARNVPLGTPTWTGQFGIAGRPEPQQGGAGRGRGGPSSASILAGLQNRQSGNLGTPGCRSSTLGSTASGPQGTDFMKMIRDYLIAQGGSVYTQMLINHFSARVGTSPARTAEFKAMLTELATLGKDAGGRGRKKWVLKDEYKGAS